MSNVHWIIRCTDDAGRSSLGQLLAVIDQWLADKHVLGGRRLEEKSNESLATTGPFAEESVKF